MSLGFIYAWCGDQREYADLSGQSLNHAIEFHLCHRHPCLSDTTAVILVLLGNVEQVVLYILDQFQSWKWINCYPFTIHPRYMDLVCKCMVFDKV
jgi:hypothetical protein